MRHYFSIYDHTLQKESRIILHTKKIDSLIGIRLPAYCYAMQDRVYYTENISRKLPVLNRNYWAISAGKK